MAFKNMCSCSVSSTVLPTFTCSGTPLLKKKNHSVSCPASIMQWICAAPRPPTPLPSPRTSCCGILDYNDLFWCLPTGKACWSLKMCTPTTQPWETPTCWRRRWKKMLRNWMPSDKNYINLRWLRTCVPVPVLLHVRLQLRGSGGPGVFVVVAVAVVHLGACAVRNGPRCPCSWCVVFGREAVSESSLLVMSVHLFLGRELEISLTAGNVCHSVLEVEAVWNFHLIMSVCF